jgi:hypothetical protein
MNSTDDLDRRRPADTDESDLLPDEPSMKPETADEIRSTPPALEPDAGEPKPANDNSPIGTAGGAGMTNPTTSQPDPDQERFRERRM